MRLWRALEDGGDDYWAVQVMIQAKLARAWLLHVQEQHDEAVMLLGSAANLEDETEKSAITPGPLVPARELRGEMFLELDRPEWALSELEMALEKGADRFRSLFGAARAAEQAGDLEKARHYYGEAVRLCAGSDGPEREEVRQARAFLEQDG